VFEGDNLEIECLFHKFNQLVVIDVLLK
jgi:hypothetical protein